MNNFTELALTRRSIRKYTEQDISQSEIEELIRIAVSAPSGCDSQCWRFVSVRDKKVIGQIADAVVDKVISLLDKKQEKVPETYLASKKKMLTFFTKAPVVVAVFMTQLEYYDPTLITALKEQGYDEEGIMQLFASPDLLSIGAAVQNLLLAAHEKGYGACWMNEPAIAGGEIRQILQVPSGSRFISLIPIGYPAYSPREKRMKDFDEVYTSI